MSLLATPTDISNQALLHLGVFAEIQNLDTDTSKEGRVMRRLYDNVRRSLLSLWAWPFACVYQQGALVSFWPSPEWAFAWQYPGNCLKFNRIYNFKHVDDIDNKIQYIQSNDGNQRLILSNFGPAQLLPANSYVPTQNTTPISAVTDQTSIPIFEFIADVTNCAIMPQLFKEALAFVMAAYASPSLQTGTGAAELREKNLALGNAALKIAGAQNLNESFIAPEKRSLIEKAAMGGGLMIHASNVWQPVAENWNP